MRHSWIIGVLLLIVLCVSGGFILGVQFGTRVGYNGGFKAGQAFGLTDGAEQERAKWKSLSHSPCTYAPTHYPSVLSRPYGLTCATNQNEAVCELRLRRDAVLWLAKSMEKP